MGLMRIKPSDLHWLAGVIDKGCAITATKTGWGNIAQTYGYTVRICISSVNKSLVAKLHALTGMGYISLTLRKSVMKYHGSRKRSSTTKDRYTLLIHGQEAVDLLRMVMPYLRTQERRAETAVAIYGAMQNRRRRVDGAVYQQDVDKIDRLIASLKQQGTRTKCLK